MGIAVAVVGATDLVGGEMLALLGEGVLPVEQVFALASRQSIGREVSCADKSLLCQDMEHFDFSRVALAFFALETKQAQRLVPKAAASGALCIDTSRVFRMDKAVPLIVPEVNAKALDGFRGRIVAVPNSMSAQLASVIAPLHSRYGVTRISCTGLTAVSAAGRAASDELFNQTRTIFLGQSPRPKHLPQQIAFNLIPQIGAMTASGYSEEEQALAHESPRILDAQIRISATCIRVPVFVGHAMSISLECGEKPEIEEVCTTLRSAPGLMLADTLEDNDNKTLAGSGYKTPVECVGSYATFVGRLRMDALFDNGIALWSVADNLHKGAAHNAIEIARAALARNLL